MWGLDSFYWGRGGAGAPCLSLQFATLLTLERSLPFSLSVFFNVLKFHCSHLNFNDRQPRHSKLRYDARKRKPNDWTRPPLEYSSEEESPVRGQFTAWIRTD